VAHRHNCIVPNAWSAVEIHYQAFANSGSLTLWLDDVQKQSITFIDNDTRTITDIRLGAQGIETGISGTIYFDDFESRRFSYIGTLTDPGVNDPQASNPPGWTGSTYSYSATIPHAVTSIAIESGGTNTYEYDANGNMTCRIENGVVYTHTYNAENRASSIAKRNTNCTGTIIESWSFAYDGDGTRVLTAHFTGTSGTPDSTTSYFMGGQYELKDGAVKKYYSIAGMTVATQDASGLQYLLTDHLGSTVAVTNSSGTLTSQQRYLPFGEARTIPNSPILGTDFTYTGQRKLDDGMGGIMDYKARFYSPALGRFLQPDSIIPDQFNPQSWNRYSYVTNRPVNFNDPTGHVACEGERWDDGPQCVQSKDFKENVEKEKEVNKIRAKFKNVTVKDIYDWELADLKEIYFALNRISGKNGFNGNTNAFIAAFGTVTFIPVPGDYFPGPQVGDALWRSGIIRLEAGASSDTVIHEMGHILDGNLDRINNRAPLHSQTFVDKFNEGSCTRSPCYAENGGWLPSGVTTLHGESSSMEDFADSFLALIKYDPQTQVVSKERIAIITALIQIYTNPSSYTSPGR